jgi:hypothetical protein
MVISFLGWCRNSRISVLTMQIAVIYVVLSSYTCSALSFTANLWFLSLNNAMLSHIPCDIRVNIQETLWHLHRYFFLLTLILSGFKIIKNILVFRLSNALRSFNYLKISFVRYDYSTFLRCLCKRLNDMVVVFLINLVLNSVELYV